MQWFGCSYRSFEHFAQLCMLHLHSISQGFSLTILALLNEFIEPLNILL